MSNTNMERYQLQESNQIRIIQDEQYVKAEKQGKYYAEVTVTDKKPIPTVKKQSKDEYLVISTGEIKTYQGNQTDEDRIKALRKTFHRLRGLLRHNFDSDSANQLFITLTYAENMTDEKRLYSDFEKFMKRLKYKYSEHNLEYVVVAEPQERGAWHMHLMLKSDKPVLYIHYEDLNKLWGHGHTKTERLKSDDIGAYYVAYFTDILPDNGDVKKKKKGARLHLYPKNFKFYRKSRGIKEPEAEMIKYKEIKKEYGEPKFAQQYELIDTEEQRTVNVFYKSVHKKEKPTAKKPKPRKTTTPPTHPV